MTDQPGSVGTQSRPIDIVAAALWLNSQDIDTLPGNVAKAALVENGDVRFKSEYDEFTNDELVAQVGGSETVLTGGHVVVNGTQKSLVRWHIGPIAVTATVTSTNSPVVATNTLNVDYQLENRAPGSQTTDVWLEVGGTERDRDSGVSVGGGGGTATGTLQYNTQQGDDGDFTAEVFTKDDRATASVTVLPVTGDVIWATSSRVQKVPSEWANTSMSSIWGMAHNPGDDELYFGYEEPPYLRSVDATDGSTITTQDFYRNLSSSEVTDMAWLPDQILADLTDDDIYLFNETFGENDSFTAASGSGSGHITTDGSVFYLAEWDAGEPYDANLRKFDPSGGSLSQDFRVDYGGKSSIATKMGIAAVYVADDDNTIYKIDPNQGTVDATYALGTGANDLTHETQDTIVVCDSGSDVSKIDFTTSPNSIAWTTSLNNSSTALTYDGQMLWAGDSGGRLYEIDPSNGSISQDFDADPSANSIEHLSSDAWSPHLHSAYY